jgi:hypothetical protein
MYFNTFSLAFIIFGLFIVVFGIVLVAIRDKSGYFFITIGGIVVLLISIMAMYTFNYTVSGIICQKEMVSESTNIKVNDTWYEIETKDYLNVNFGDYVTLDVVKRPTLFGDYITGEILEAPKHTGECGGMTTCNCNCSFVKGV